MAQDSQYLTREIAVRGKVVTVYSADNCRWFSSTQDLKRYEQLKAKTEKTLRDPRGRTVSMRRFNF